MALQTTLMLGVTTLFLSSTINLAAFGIYFVLFSCQFKKSS